MNRFLREYVYVSDLQDSHHALVYRMGLIENSDEQVGARCYPDLGLHRVLAGSVESFDAQVLFVSLEKQ